MSIAAHVGELLPVQRPGGGDVAVGEPDRLGPLVNRWLLACAVSPHTLTAYRADVALWFRFCQLCNVDPLAAGTGHVDAWQRWLESTLTCRGRPPSVATLARRVATVASFYSYLMDEGVVSTMPVRRRGRPKAPTESTTIGLSRDEARAFLARLAAESTTDRAVITVLIVLGLRVSELIGLNVGSIRFNSGQVTATVAGKGRKVRTVVLSARCVTAVDGMLDERAHRLGVAAGDLPADGPLFVRAGGGRYTQQSVTRVVQRIARAAGIRSHRALSPHSMRHACATLMLDDGIPINIVAAHLGHASEATTGRYDRARGALHRSPVHRLDSYLASEG